MIVFFVSGLVTWAPAQEQRCYRITHRVQIRMVNGDRHAGKLFAINDSAVRYLLERTDHLIAPGEIVDPVAVPLTGIQRMALDGVDEVKDGAIMGTYLGGIGGLVAGGVVLAGDGSFSTPIALLPLLGAGVGWLLGAVIGSLPEKVVKHRGGGPWSAEERQLVRDRLPLRCDSAQ